MTTAISAGTADALLMGIMGLQASETITTGRILVVDDDPGARDLIVSSLRADGHDVDASGNAFEALRLLGRQCYDLIVSDLMMPEVNGFEVVVERGDVTNRTRLEDAGWLDKGSAATALNRFSLPVTHLVVGK
jgi:PleD family two-component response regulator